LGANRN